MRLILLVFPAALLAVPITAFAQPISFGVVGGAGLTQDFQNQILPGSPGFEPISLYSTPKRWIAGAMIEVRLPKHLSVELDGLYHELEYTIAGVNPNGTLNSVSPSPVVTWELPVLAKYRFSSPPVVKPFVEAGPAFRSPGNLNGTQPSNYGFAAGGGVEARAWKLKIAPQVRYLHWTADSSHSYFAPSTVSDQVELLVTLSY
jgi:hypothetical protein